LAHLTRNRRKALEALLATATVREAAARCGLGERTVYRYLSAPEFAAALQQRQDAVLAGVVVALSGLSVEAVADVRKALQILSAEAKGGSLDAARLGRLALAVLTERRRQVETADLVARVAKLEETLGKKR